MVTHNNEDQFVAAGELIDHALSVRILFIMRDFIPTFRPDVTALFGKALPYLGVLSDLIGQRWVGTDPSNDAWPAGKVVTFGNSKPGVWAEVFKTWHDLLGVIILVNSNHDIIQVRDKIRGGLLGLFIGRILRKPVTYWMSFPMAESFIVRSRQIGRSKGWLRGRPSRGACCIT